MVPLFYSLIIMYQKAVTENLVNNNYSGPFGKSSLRNRSCSHSRIAIISEGEQGTVYNIMREIQFLVEISNKKCTNVEPNHYLVMNGSILILWLKVVSTDQHHVSVLKFSVVCSKLFVQSDADYYSPSGKRETVTKVFHSLYSDFTIPPRIN